MRAIAGSSALVVGNAALLRHPARAGHADFPVRDAGAQQVAVAPIFQRERDPVRDDGRVVSLRRLRLARGEEQGGGEDRKAHVAGLHGGSGPEDMRSIVDFPFSRKLDAVASEADRILRLSAKLLDKSYRLHVQQSDMEYEGCPGTQTAIDREGA